jgi:hypothetical protein
MAKVAGKQKRILDIAIMLEAGMKRKEILQKTAKNFKVSSRTVDEYIKEAGKIVSERNKQKEAIRVKVTNEETMNAVKEAIISDIELEGILCTIATGNLKVEEIVRGNAVLRGISPFEIIAAIDKLYRKRNSYPATKLNLAGANGGAILTANVPLSKDDIKLLSQQLEDDV